MQFDRRINRIGTLMMAMLLAFALPAGVIGAGFVGTVSADDADEMTTGLSSSGTTVYTEGFNGTKSDWDYIGAWGDSPSISAGNDAAVIGDGGVDNQYIELTSTPSPSSQQWTMEATVSTMSSQVQFWWGLDTSTSSFGGHSVKIEPENDRVRIWDSVAGETVATSSYTIDTETEYDVGIQYDAGTVDVYVDGEQVISGATLSDPQTSGSVLVGGHTDTSGNTITLHSMEIRETPDTYTLGGTVTNNRTGTAISGADVTLKDASTGEVVSTVTTADSGTYSFDVKEGDYTVRVEAPGYETDEQTVTVDSATTHDVALSVEVVTGSVSGDGSAVADATVELVSDGTVVTSATTDSSGQYTLQPQTPGSYTISVSATDYEDDSATIDTTSQTQLNFDLTETVHSFTGTVIDSRTSEAVANASVELVQDGSVVASTTTGSSGEYDLGNHEEGTYTLRVEGDAYVGDTYDVTVAGPLDKAVALHPSNTWTYDLSGNGDSMWAVYEASGTVDVTVEAYDEDAGEWVVVHEQQYTTNGTSTEQDVLEINATEDGYTEYRVTMQGEIKPSAVGVTSVTPIFGVAETISEVSGLSSGIVVGALVTGVVWMVLRARE
ncbi:carboxypeptidase regulatory-like domain-containing protein [Halomicrobium sp. LC1Hm]|uniref:carboxypeptidase regulatory-like domain-containing protein n=1 Tax=Halomicrobium sp. LC1Hm TaxID=2610902 RepID=UPI0012982D6B|nr:carboxypeptidase regulatory-like domain-containing protein [Halomicrobium sp. LC1Hm]